ncbi:hypothetical protein [Sphingobacterium litopenaei]|uniref:Uncharacterized protein n=1 Tax=Sphingobacterium litopenaei TaxID=2763500 RepID=A0ABR7YH39_9SPHI|nr:hypothetical protein [Sphingobacterium litopenaei]MBD1430612.1 hypothetical protein [Sphingobacterium litopenaei]
MKPTQFERLANLEKGIAKLQRGERVMASRVVSEDRMVQINSKVVIAVKARDSRSDEQIRREWILKHRYQSMLKRA